MLAHEFAALRTTPISTAVTVGAPTWAEIVLEIWMFATANDVRAGINLSGATISAPAAPQLGAVGWVSAPSGSTAANKQIARKLIVLNAGVTTVTAQAMRTSTGTQTVSHPVLSVTPIRAA